MENVQLKHFELGVALILYKWTALRVAVQNNWGGPDSSDKRDWFAGAVLELFEGLKTLKYAEDIDGNEVDEVDVEARLLQVMQDEFNVDVDDFSAFENARDIMMIYKECCEGNYDTVKKLQLQNVQLPNITPILEGSETSKDEDQREKIGTDTQTEIQPSKPMVDEDGFEMVCHRNRQTR